MVTRKDEKTREVDSVRKYRSNRIERKEKTMPKTTKAVEDALLHEQKKKSAKKKAQQKKKKPH